MKKAESAFFFICGGIAYLLTIIGLIVGRISAANAALFDVWHMIVLEFRVSAIYAGLFSDFFYCFFILL